MSVRQSGKSGTLRESNQASGVRKRITRSTSILLRKISFVACGFSPIKIHLSDYPKSLISKINEVICIFLTIFY